MLKAVWHRMREVNCQVEPPETPNSFLSPSTTLIVNGVHRGRAAGVIVIFLPCTANVAATTPAPLSTLTNLLISCPAANTESRVSTMFPPGCALALPILAPNTLGPPDVLNASEN